MRQRDIEATLLYLRELYAQQDLDGFKQHVLTTIADLVPSEFTTYNELDLRTSNNVWQWEPTPSDFAELTEIFATYMGENPCVAYYRRTGDGRATKDSPGYSAGEEQQGDSCKPLRQPTDRQDAPATHLQEARGREPHRGSGPGPPASRHFRSAGRLEPEEPESPRSSSIDRPMPGRSDSPIVRAVIHARETQARAGSYHDGLPLLSRSRRSLLQRFSRSLTPDSAPLSLGS